MVAQPNWLLVFNEPSGSSDTSVTNYGTTTGTYTLQDDATAPAMAETTDYVWHPNAGNWSGSGYLESKTKNTHAMPWLATTATTPGQSLDNINVAVAFYIRSVDNGAARLVSCSTANEDGGFSIYTTNHSGSTFDLVVKANHNGGSGLSATITGLSTSTWYQVAASIDVSTPATAVLKVKLGSNAVVTKNSTTDPTTCNYTSFKFEDGWPLLLRRQDFTYYFGLDGYIGYFAYQRGPSITPWDDTALGNVNSSPNSNITGWPTNGTSITPTQGSLAFSGKQPTVLVPVIITPAAAAVALAGKQASVSSTNSPSITPAAAALALAGLQPSLSLGTPTPPPGVLSLVGYQPGVSAITPTIVTPGAGALTGAGFQPSQQLDVPPPFPGNLAFLGYQPTVSQGNSNQAATPSAGALALSGKQPGVFQAWFVQGQAGALALSGKQPGVTIIIAGQPATSAGAVVLTGYAPSLKIEVVTPLTLTPGPGTLVLAGKSASRTVGLPTGYYPTYF